MKIGFKKSEYKNENQAKFWVFYGKKVREYKNFLGQNFFYAQFSYACPSWLHYKLLFNF